MAGVGNITKLGERRYRVRVTLGTDEKGKRIIHDKVIHGAKREAEQYLAGILRDRDMGKFAEPSKVRVGEYLEQWLEQAARQKLRERSFNDYTDIVMKRIKPRVGHVALDKLTPLAVQTFYNELTASGYSPLTVRKTHNVLQSALRQAVKWRMLQHNPAVDAELPRLVKKERPALDSRQAERFIEAAKQEQRGIAYLVGLFTGMRPGEYLALQWPDLNLDTGAIRVQRTIFWPRGGGWRFEETKTDGSRRTVIMPGKLLPMLREHRRRQLEQRLLLGELWQNHDLVFAGETGTPLLMGNLNKRHFKKILESAGLPLTLRPYDLRHSCATLLLERGKSPKIVAERLGHASTVMTMNVYSHVTPTMQQEAADALDELL